MSHSIILGCLSVYRLGYKVITLNFCSQEGYKVTLHAYDLSGGLARQLSMSFLGKAIEAIW